MQLCVNLLDKHQSERTIIFRRTKFGVEKLDLYLKEKGFKVESIHGGKTQALRQEALKTFKNGGANILIATDVAARGIDIEALELVINFDIPNKPETYIHRIGRTGRADRFGQSFAFCAAEERHFIPGIQNLTKSVISVVEDHPFPLAADAQPAIHKRKGSKYKKGRKSEASKKKKKRWY